MPGKLIDITIKLWILKNIKFKKKSAQKLKYKIVCSIMFVIGFNFMSFGIDTK